MVPVTSMADGLSQRISIDRMEMESSDFKTQQQYENATYAHRDEGHTFHIVEVGTVLIEIDFQKYEIMAPSVVYMHPNQVHRILGFEQVTVGSMAIESEALNPAYLEFLEEMVPAQPLMLTQDAQATVSAIFSICLSFSIQKLHAFHYPLLKDSCNTLVAYLISQFSQQNRHASHVSRFELISKSFRKLLDQNFRTLKRPGDYAGELNISVAYLNECVSATTGLSVTKNIHNRIILEAKRMLYHSDKSVKEIAADLGYDDFPYFSKLFNKVTGMSGLAFRNKNRD